MNNSAASVTALPSETICEIVEFLNVGDCVHLQPISIKFADCCLPRMVGGCAVSTAHARPFQVRGAAPLPRDVYKGMIQARKEDIRDVGQMQEASNDQTARAAFQQVIDDLTGKKERLEQKLARLGDGDEGESAGAIRASRPIQGATPPATTATSPTSEERPVQQQPKQWRRPAQRSGGMVLGASPVDAVFSPWPLRIKALSVAEVSEDWLVAAKRP